jgi:hypothetical protein
MKLLVLLLALSAFSFVSIRVEAQPCCWVPKKGAKKWEGTGGSRGGQGSWRSYGK